MKDLAQQIVEAKDANIAKGRTADQISEAMKHDTEEKRLSALTLLLENKKIVRKNGNFITESMAEVLTVDERIARTVRENNCSVREAHIFLGLKDPGPNAKPSVAIAESLRTRWTKYAPFLTSTEVDQLVAKGIEP
jgi:hypothetical protein